MSPTAMPGLIPLFCASSRVPAIDPCHRHSLKASDLVCSRDKPLGPRELIALKNELSMAFLCQPDDDNKKSLREPVCQASLLNIVLFVRRRTGGDVQTSASVERMCPLVWLPTLMGLPESPELCADVKVKTSRFPQR